MDRLAAMQTFVAVVESGSFSAAARVLAIGQPAVSKSVGQLEEVLGTRLLLRSARGLVPTEAGIRYYERARRVIEEAEEAEAAARGASASLSGRLRVSAPVTFASLHVVPKLKAFLAENPGIQADIVLDDRNFDPREEGIDVAFRLGSLVDSSMTAQRIAQCRRVVVGTKAYFDHAGVPSHPTDLTSHQTVVYAQRGGGDTFTFNKGAQEISVTTVGRLSVTAAEGVRAAVLSDVGIALSSEWMFAHELAEGRVVEVLSDWQLPRIDLWALYPSGRLVGAKARAFVQFVQATLSAATSATRYAG